MVLYNHNANKRPKYGNYNPLNFGISIHVVLVVNTERGRCI